MPAGALCPGQRCAPHQSARVAGPLCALQICRSGQEPARYFLSHLGDTAGAALYVLEDSLMHGYGSFRSLCPQTLCLAYSWDALSKIPLLGFWSSCYAFGHVCLVLDVMIGKDQGLCGDCVVVHAQMNNIASVRQYQEAILVGLLIRDPRLIEQHLLPVIANYDHR